MPGLRTNFVTSHMTARFGDQLAPFVNNASLFGDSNFTRSFDATMFRLPLRTAAQSKGSTHTRARVARRTS